MLFELGRLIGVFGLRPTGVLHLGAHIGEEAATYAGIGIADVVWVEGNPEILPALRAEVEPRGQRVVHALVTETPGQSVRLRVTNKPESSSILALGTHREHHPDIEVDHEVMGTTTTIDHLAAEHDFSRLNFLNIDLQGAELRALQGGIDTLRQIDYVYTEVNAEEVYEGCPLIDDLDAFLGDHGFYRVATRWTHARWGDALYVRRGAAVRAPRAGAALLRAEHEVRRAAGAVLRLLARLLGRTSR